MVKKSGLSQQFFIDGFDLSGDIGSIGALAFRMSPLEVPVLNQPGMVRIGGLKDGELSFNAWFNDALERSHDAVKGFPTVDSIVLAVFGGAVGDAAVGLVSKRTDYQQVRGSDGSLELTITCLATGGISLEDMVMLSAGKITHASATTGASKDDGTQASAVTITSSSAANPTNILCDGVHEYTTGDTVVIAGHSGSTPSINGEHTVTVIDTLNFTIPVNVSSGGTGGTSTLTSTRNGLAAIVEIVDIDSGTPTIIIEDSQDDSTFVTLISFTAVASGAEPAAERKTVAGVIDRHLRITTTGSFSDADFAVAYRRGIAEDDDAYA